MSEKSVDLGLKNQIKQNKTVYTCQLVPYAGNWINFLCKIWKNVRFILSYDVASESEITPWIKIDKPVYRFSGNVVKWRFKRDEQG